eukprot:363484-Chlamydomonas_euryale.AAC.3
MLQHTAPGPSSRGRARPPASHGPCQWFVASWQGWLIESSDKGPAHLPALHGHCQSFDEVDCIGSPRSDCSVSMARPL